MKWRSSENETVLEAGLSGRDKAAMSINDQSLERSIGRRTAVGERCPKRATVASK